MLIDYLCWTHKAACSRSQGRCGGRRQTRWLALCLSTPAPSQEDVDCGRVVVSVERRVYLPDRPPKQIEWPTQHEREIQFESKCLNYVYKYKNGLRVGEFGQPIENQSKQSTSLPVICATTDPSHIQTRSKWFRSVSWSALQLVYSIIVCNM